ncbi:MAG: hypothetical protein JF603_13315 [Acidobacteria bacterium]|nr:hypothetical protein [Acidobacteriota bacterium]
MLPKSLDPEALRNIAIGGLVVLALVAFMVMRFIQKMVLRVILLGALVGFGVYVWGQRQELKDCVPTCSCQFFGFDVHMPSAAGCPASASG